MPRRPFCPLSEDSADFDADGYADLTLIFLSAFTQRLDQRYFSDYIATFIFDLYFLILSFSKLIIVKKIHQSIVIV